MNIICLGSIACDIGERIKQFSYKVFQINDQDQKKNRYFLKIPKYDKAYEYEKNTPIRKFETFFKGIKGDIVFITCGKDDISLLSLMILEQLSKFSHTTVFYIKPDLMFLSKEKMEQEKVVCDYLQQYAIRDFIKQIYLVDNKMVEKIAEDVNMVNYNDKINEIISWSIHSLNFYNTQKPILDNFAEIEDYGIKTISINKFEEDSEEKILFFLDNVREKRYYYIINKESLENDKELFGKVREDIRKKVESEKKVLYGVYPSDLKENLILSEMQTMTVQK